MTIMAVAGHEHVNAGQRSPRSSIKLLMKGMRHPSFTCEDIRVMSRLICLFNFHSHDICS